MNQLMQELMTDIRRIFLSAYPGPTNYMSEIDVKDAFIATLRTLDGAYNVTERMEL